MYKSTLFALIIGCVVTGWMLEPVVAGKGKGKGGGGSTPTLDQQEIDDLMFMREEEKLARDVYIAMYALWGNQVFYNISLSEQKHTDSILALIEKYGLDDPASENIGEFNDPYLQGLYDYLISEGELGELEALHVGVLIEVTDITDIEEAMLRTDEADILNVYGNLLAGSENHLDAFLKNIEAY